MKEIEFVFNDGASSGVGKRIYEAINEAFNKSTGWDDVELNDIQRDALITTIRRHYDEDDFVDADGEFEFVSGEYLEQLILDVQEYCCLCKRIEDGDLIWLKMWKRCYEREDNKKDKNNTLKVGVLLLIEYDMRMSCPDGYISDVFEHTRNTFSEIHENYAKILNVTADEVSNVIVSLINEGYVCKVVNNRDNTFGYVSVRLCYNLLAYDYNQSNRYKLYVQYE